MSKPGFFAFPGTRRRMYGGPLGPYIDDFIDCLQKRGYDRHSIRCKIRSVADFSRWTDRRQHVSTDLDSDLVSRFMACRKRSGRYDWGDNSAVRQMIDRLRPAADTGKKVREELSVPGLGTPRSERKAEEGKLRDRILDPPVAVPAVDDPGLVWVQLQTARRKAFGQSLLHPLGHLLALAMHDCVVGVPGKPAFRYLAP